MTNLKYTMMIQWSEEDQLYLVHFPDFPEQQFITHGSTYEAAARNGQEAIEGLIAVLQDHPQAMLGRSESGLHPVDQDEPKEKILAGIEESVRSVKRGETFPVAELWSRAGMEP
jgi:predicted RNase H-like HicB family nuclease